jgi:small-conductance mechanosensitive channel
MILDLIRYAANTLKRRYHILPYGERFAARWLTRWFLFTSIFILFSVVPSTCIPLRRWIYDITLIARSLDSAVAICILLCTCFVRHFVALATSNYIRLAITGKKMHLLPSTRLSPQSKQSKIGHSFNFRLTHQISILSRTRTTLPRTRNNNTGLLRAIEMTLPYRWQVQLSFTHTPLILICLVICIITTWVTYYIGTILIWSLFSSMCWYQSWLPSARSAYCFIYTHWFHHAAPTHIYLTKMLLWWDY